MHANIVAKEIHLEKYIAEITQKCFINETEYSIPKRIM